MKLAKLGQKNFLLRLGLENLPPSLQTRLRQLVMEIFNLQFLDAILVRLPEAEQKKLLKLLAEDEKKTIKFLQEKFDDLEKIVDEVIAKVEKDLEKDLKAIKKL